MGGLLDDPDYWNRLGGILAGPGGPLEPRRTGGLRAVEGVQSVVPQGGFAPVAIKTGGSGLKAAAVRIDGKLFKGRTHNEAIGAAEAALGRPVFREYVDQGYVNSRGRFVSRDDPGAAMDALAANQIKDPLVRELVENSIKRGHPSPLTAEHLDFSAFAQ